MSIETEFESTITNVKNAYQGLDNLGATIPQNKTIENIKNCLDEIYDNLPKTSYAEGSNITLSNTLKGKLDFEDGIVGIGDTKQEGTPTPDNPQEIEVVRGKNRAKLEAEGKYRVFSTGNFATNANFNSYIADVQPMTAYITSAKNIATQYTEISNLCYFDKNMNYISGITYNTADKSFTTPNNCYYVTMAVNVSIEEVQTEKGSQATSYLPYNTLEVVERGKNEWGGVSYAIGNLFTTNADGSFDINLVNAEGTSATTVPAVQNGLVKTLKAGTYTFSAQGINNGNLAVHIVKVNSPTSGQVIQNLTNIVTSKTFTIEEDIEYFVRVQAVSPITYSGTIYAQIEQGSTATTYEPYQTPQTYQLSLGEYEFAKIGNYVDTIEYDVDEDKVYKKEKIKKLNFADFSNFVRDNSWSNTTGFYFVYNEGRHGISGFGTVSDLYCNRLISGAPNSIVAYATEVNKVGLGNNNCIYFSIEGITTKAGYNTYFSENPTILYYKLETPTLTEITGTLADQIKALYYSHSFTGTTIIEIDGQLPLIIKVRALKAS